MTTIGALEQTVLLPQGTLAERLRADRLHSGIIRSNECWRLVTSGLTAQFFYILKTPKRVSLAGAFIAAAMP